MIELNGRLIAPAHVAIIENMPGKEGHVRLYVGGVALITPGTLEDVRARIFGPPPGRAAGVLADVEALMSSEELAEAKAEYKKETVHLKKPKKGKAGGD